MAKVKKIPKVKKLSKSVRKFIGTDGHLTVRYDVTRGTDGTIDGAFAIQGHRDAIGMASVFGWSKETPHERNKEVMKGIKEAQQISNHLNDYIELLEGTLV